MKNLVSTFFVCVRSSVGGGALPAQRAVGSTQLGFVKSLTHSH